MGYRSLDTIGSASHNLVRDWVSLVPRPLINLSVYGPLQSCNIESWEIERVPGDKDRIGLSDSLLQVAYNKPRFLALSLPVSSFEKKRSHCRVHNDTE